MTQKKQYGDGDFVDTNGKTRSEETNSNVLNETREQFVEKSTRRSELSGDVVENRATENDGAEQASSQSESAAESTLRAFRQLTSDEDRTVSHKQKFTFWAFVGGDIFGGKWFRQNFFFIVMVVAMMIVYVSNRYACQQEMLETKSLSDTLLDRRYKALTRSSQLKERTRRSSIEESLVDTTLQTSITPSFNLRVE